MENIAQIERYMTIFAVFLKAVFKYSYERVQKLWYCVCSGGWFPSVQQSS